LSAWDGIPPQVLAPAPRHRVGLDRAVRDAVGLEQHREADDHSLRVANDTEGLGCRLPPREQMPGSRRRLVTTHDRRDRRGVCGRRPLDRVHELARREERLTNGRLIDQVEHVGGVAPELGRRHRRQLVAEVAPGGGAMATVRDGIGAAQGASDRLADRVVDDQPVVSELHEREGAHTLEHVVRRTFGQHCPEQ
jgi:hypothetical protein